MDLRDLGYFVAIARHGSLTRASEALELSAAALSKSLRRLETAIDAKLMERAPKGVALTSSGKLLLARAETLRLAVEDVKREAAEIGAGRAGLLHIGVNPIDSERVAVACMTLRAQAPELRFKVTVSSTDAMLPLLRSGELDLVFNLQPAVPHDGIAQEILFRDDVVVCASPSHPFARRRRLSVADVAQQHWVLNAADVRPRQALEQALRERGFPPPKIALESVSIQVRMAALAHSETLGLHSRRLMRQTAASQFRAIEIPVRDLVCPIVACASTRKNSYLPRSARRLIELMRSPSRWTN